MEENIDGIRIIPAPVFKNRLFRVLFSPLRIFFLARGFRAKIYHFHDPELIITGLLLRLFTRARVIYDIHEDYKTSIRQKYYLPKGIAAGLAVLFGFFENTAAKCFRLVLAEKYYSRRFPKGIPVLNYPVIRTGGENENIEDKQGFAAGEEHDRPLPEMASPENHPLLYTGVIAEDRGALLHAGMLSYLSDIDLYMVGFCRKDLVRRMEDIIGDNYRRFHLEGEDIFVHPARIQHYYKRKEWLAGLAIFPPTSHYMNKELTKIFEYMSAGIPVICSDFPVWRELVVGVGAGMVVDPSNQESIKKAVEYIKTHPPEAEKMGERGKRAVWEQYNWSLEIQKLTALYKNLID